MVIVVEPTPEKEFEALEAAYRHVVLQQSVTMLAYMDRSTQNVTELTSVPEPRVLLGFSVHDLPILIGAAAGAVGLTVIILVAIIVWHCCQLSGTREKEYTGNENGVLQVPHSTVVHGANSSRVYETQVVENNHDGVSQGLTRSQSLPFRENNQDSTNGRSRTRPASQPLHIPTLERNAGDAESQPMPSIVEGSARLQDVPALTQCASCNTLEEPLDYTSMHTMDFLLKTRSLPTWSHHGKLRPMSTEDDLNELYAKVSFSKKRKNRMGNDCAAAIALTKSRCSTLASNHEDTDPLVDNEAVVVYDERTAV